MVLHAIVPEDKIGAEASTISETSSDATLSHTILVGQDLADSTTKKTAPELEPRATPGPAVSVQSGALPGQLIFPLHTLGGQSFGMPGHMPMPGQMPMQPGMVSVPM
eukprot:2737556-Rhodomonas_salina.1